MRTEPSRLNAGRAARSPALLAGLAAALGWMTVIAAEPAAAQATAAPAAAPTAASHGASAPGAAFVGYLQQQALPVMRNPRLRGAPVKRLSEDRGSGRLALYALLPAGFHEHQRSRDARWNAESFEIFVVAGDVGFGAERLGRYDFAYSPAGVARPPLSSDKGAEALVFFDPATTDADARAKLAAIGPYVTRYSTERWNPGTVSQAAGVNVDLRIQHLKKDPLTGARTWLVRLAPGVAVPWERHSVVEEGFLLEGRYALAECLPQGTRRGEYTAGGYFHRPGGVPHSGPGSGPLEPSVWLMRSPAQLDVRFFGDCRDGSATQPVQ